MQVHIKNQHNQLQLDFDPEITWIDGDPDRIKQILLNLLSNATKFTQDGSITIRIKKESRNQQAWVACQVIDTGIGIDSIEQKQLFRLFHQVDNSSTRDHGGLGISLALSLRFARMMRGDLTLESQLGEGSCFTLWLPLSLS
jgi:signal transduction histidine kinase